MSEQTFSLLVTSLSRTSEQLEMAAGLVEADVMGGCGEEQKEVRMGGDVEDECVGG